MEGENLDNRENIDPNRSFISERRNSSDNGTPGKKLVLPKEYFEFTSDVAGKNASLYKCLFPGCLTKRKDGSDKALMVSNVTRRNAKRHFLKHDPNNELGHLEKWNEAIKKLSADESSTSTRISTLDQLKKTPILTQKQLDDWVLNFLIVDVLPINTVEKPGFINLVAGLAPQLQLHGRTFFNNLLETKFQERRDQLMDALSKCTDASTTVDAWTCRRRSYLGETIHWFDCKSLQRKSACLGIRRIVGRHTFDVLSNVIEGLHNEFGVAHKLRGTTTDNGSNFVKAFRERGDISTVPNYEDVDIEDEEEEDFMYFEIGDILDERSFEQPSITNVTLPQHRRCACHLFSLIAKVDVIKIHDFYYTQLRNSTFEKLNVLWSKQSSNSLNSDIIMRHLEQLLVLRNETRWNAEYNALSCIVRLLRKKAHNLRKLFEEFRIPPFTPNEEQYLKEYVRIMKIVAEALDILQGEKNVGMGYLLPTISILKTKLRALQDDAAIINCQALITSLLDAIHFRFNSMFSENELRLAAICNPMFKLSWLDNDDEIRRGKTLLKGEFQRFQDIQDESDTSEDSSDGTSSISDQSPQKIRKCAKKFFSSISKRNEKSQTHDEVDLYLKLCTNLEQLDDFPTIKKMYKRYNVTLPASAAVERLFSQGGLIFTPRRLNLTDRNFEMLLFLKFNNSLCNKW